MLNRKTKNMLCKWTTWSWLCNGKFFKSYCLYDAKLFGAVAHQGERIPCTDEVAGSIPVSSTKIICWVNDIRERNGGRPAGEETKTEWPTLEKFKSVYPIRPTLCGNGWGINLGDKLWEFHWNIWRCSIYSHIQSSAQHLRVSYNGNTWDFQSHDVGSIPTTRSIPR